METPPLLLDSYAAKSCLHALHWRRVADPTDALPVPGPVLRRTERGVEFEHLVGERLGVLAPTDWRLLRRDRNRRDDEAGWREDRRRRLHETVAALESRAALVWNPLLPPDLVGHRSGEPDLLRLAPSGVHYLPLDVKAHRLARRSAAARPSFEHSLESLLDTAAPTALLALSECAHVEDLLQLAHYVAMLEVLGLAPSAPHLGAIIGLSSDGSGEPVVAWVDLDEAGLSYRSGLTLETRDGSVRDCYRDYFADALAVSTRAEAVARGADLPPLSEPWFLDGLCSSCTWRKPCGEEMLGARHVSLVKPASSLRPVLRADDLRTVEALADVEDDGLLARPSWRASVRRARMALAGDALPIALWPEHATGAAPRLWRRPNAPEPWAAERADVELDVDMECTEDFVYLWGTLLSYRKGALALSDYAPGYRPFGAAFPEMDDASQCEVFAALWGFLDALRADCTAAGLTFATFGYNLGSAEDRWMNRCAVLLDGANGGSRWGEKLAEFRQSGSWRDLLPVARDRFESLNGLGLKVVATALGFHWRDEDPGGANSMGWYELATRAADEQVRFESRRRLLEYNEDDVRATLHLRDWLSSHGPDDLGVLPEAQYRAKTVR